MHNLPIDFECFVSFTLSSVQWFRWADVALQVLFKYFQHMEIPWEESLTAAYESLKENPPECITVEEIETVQKILQVDKLQNKKGYVYGEKEKEKIAKFAWEHGHATTVGKFMKKFPTLTESTVRPCKIWKKSGKKMKKLL